MDEDGIGSETRTDLEDHVDALFRLPLADFIGARNDLAARLKRAGRGDDASLVKGLAKPSISAWAVNQLHWKHRETFDRLLASSQRFRKAQASHTAARIADMRVALDARSEALSHLSELATELLRDAGHNPTPDTIHRITTTLEAVSAYATLSDGLTLGRLTQDVDPPGFESLALSIPGTAGTERNNEHLSVTPSQESGSAATKTRQRASPADDVEKFRRAEETRRAMIASAKVSLQEAKKSMTEARSRAQRLEAAEKKADAGAKEAVAVARKAEKQLRQAEESFKKASAASQDAAHRAQRIGAELEEAAKSVEDAKRTVEKASKELEALLQNSTAR